MQALAELRWEFAILRWILQFFVEDLQFYVGFRPSCIEFLR